MNGSTRKVGSAAPLVLLLGFCSLLGVVGESGGEDGTAPKADPAAWQEERIRVLVEGYDDLADILPLQLQAYADRVSEALEERGESRLAREIQEVAASTIEQQLEERSSSEERLEARTKGRRTLQHWIEEVESTIDRANSDVATLNRFLNVVAGKIEGAALGSDRTRLALEGVALGSSFEKSVRSTFGQVLEFNPSGTEREEGVIDWRFKPVPASASIGESEPPPADPPSGDPPLADPPPGETPPAEEPPANNRSAAEMLMNPEGRLSAERIRALEESFAPRAAEGEAGGTPEPRKSSELVTTRKTPEGRQTLRADGSLSLGVVGFFGEDLESRDIEGDMSWWVETDDGRRLRISGPVFDASQFGPGDYWIVGIFGVTSVEFEVRVIP